MMNTISNNSIVDIGVSDINVKNDRDSVNSNKTEQAVIKDIKVTEEQSQAKADVSVEQLEVVAQKLQEFVGKMNKGLEFLVDQDSGRDVIKVIDKTNGDLIKQYPSEEVLDLVTKLSEATGSLFNEQV